VGQPACPPRNLRHLPGWKSAACALLQRELHTARCAAGWIRTSRRRSPCSRLIDARAQRELLKKRLLRAVLMSGWLLLVVLLSVWLRPDQLLVALLDPWGTAADEFYGSFRRADCVPVA
jgi:hypothetical protein